MSEYFLKFTGEQLDDAINKVRSGYIFPSGESPVITTNGTHPVREFENAVVNVPIPAGYVLPDETINITENVSNKDISKGKILNVNVPIPSNYINFKNYYFYEYTQNSATLETSHTFNCGFKPKLVIITLKGDTTISTTNAVMFACRIAIDGLTSIGTGQYKLGTSNRNGSFGGGLSASNFTNTGFTFSHGNIGLNKSTPYNVYAWG